jgi:hypothetical protein
MSRRDSVTVAQYEVLGARYEVLGAQYEVLGRFGNGIRPGGTIERRPSSKTGWSYREPRKARDSTKSKVVRES